MCSASTPGENSASRKVLRQKPSGGAAAEVLTVQRSARTSHFVTDSSLHEILVDSALWGDKFIICVVGVQVCTVLGYCRILSGLLAVADRLGSIVPVRAEGRWKNVPVPTLLLTSVVLTDYIYLSLCELHERHLPSRWMHRYESQSTSLTPSKELRRVLLQTS